jgi:hypothetical protein
MVMVAWPRLPARADRASYRPERRLARYCVPMKPARAYGRPARWTQRASIGTGFGWLTALTVQTLTHAPAAPAHTSSA